MVLVVCKLQWNSHDRAGSNVEATNQRRWDMAENDDFGYPNRRSPLGRIPSSQEIIRPRRERVTTTLPIRFGPALQ
jgi:hypothetical protein